jgi:peroxiredoxin
MSASARRVAGVGALVLIVLILGLSAWWLGRPAETPVRFTLLDSSHVELKSLRGHPVLVTFWATTCRPCITEAPRLAEFYRQWHPRGLELIAVAMPYDPPWSVAEWQQRLKMPYPVALDFDGSVVRAFGDITLIPAAVLIGPDGRERWRHTGTLDFQSLDKDMRAMLPTAKRP